MSTGFDQAAAQIRSQSELAGSSPLGSQDPGQLGQQAAAEGAQVTNVDVDELFAYIRDLQSRVEAVEAERAAERKGTRPGIVEVAENLKAQIEHRHGALGAHNPILKDAVDLAGKIAEAAATAAETGVPGEILSLAGALASKLTRLSSGAASADVSYPLQLATEDLPEIAADLRARGSVVQGQVVSSHTAAPPRKLYAPVR